MGLAKQLIDKATGILNTRIQAEIAFFNVPPSMKAMRLAAEVSIKGILSGLKTQIQSQLNSLTPEQIALLGLGLLLQEFSDANVKSAVQRSKKLREVNRQFGYDVNASINCEFKDKTLDNLLNNRPIDANSLLNRIQTLSDFDENINDKSHNNLLEDLFNDIQSILPWLLLAYALFLKIQDFIQSNRYPSKFRAGYLQSILRNFAGSLKKAGQNLGSSVKDKVDPLLIPFKTIDAIILGLTLASILYLRNREIGQQKSKEHLQLMQCEPFIEEVDVSINVIPIKENPLQGFTCPLPDNAIVPHIPIEEKLKQLDCPIDSSASYAQIEADPAYDVATKAILENLSNNPFNISVVKDQKVEPTTSIGKIGDTNIFSTVTGYVSKIEPNKVWLRDISDIGNSLFEETTQKLKVAYEELNQTKIFIKDYQIDSWLPPMLASTPYVDPSDNSIPLYTFSITNNWKKYQKQADHQVDVYTSQIEKIAGKDNVKNRADNNQLGVLKDEFDEQEELLYIRLNQIANAAIKTAKTTKIDDGDLIYSDYLSALIENLVAADDQNNIVTTFTAKLNTFLLDRFFVEEKNLKDIIYKINKYSKELYVGNKFDQPKFYEVMNERYEQKGITEVQAYAKTLGNNNKQLSEEEKKDIANKIIFLFNFTRQILDKQTQDEEYKPAGNIAQISFKEGSFIIKYFANLYKRLKDLPIEIAALEKEVEDLGKSSVPPSIITIDDEQYEWYGLEGPKPCPSDNDTAYDFGDIEYWLKYCTFATLASVANPTRGWSTGIPPPIGPIPFPVIYIPFKSFMTKWGFIVVGLTITGIFPFPWVLFGNLSSNYNTPIGDPTAFIKNEINALKNSLTQGLKNFKQGILKGYLDKQKVKVDESRARVDKITIDKREHKTQRPKKDRTKTSLQDRQSHITSVAQWTKTQAQYTELLAEAKGDRFVQETKYKVVWDAYSTGGSIENTGTDATLKSIEKSQASLDSQVEKLNVLVDQVDKILIPLPISMQPVTANFGITAKNVRPIIKIKGDLDQNVNSGAVQKIIDKFNLGSEDFMNSNYANKVDNSIINFDKYKSALNLARFSLLDQDPFPKYENLSPINTAWIPFLYNYFTVKGAQSFGFPGQPPLPIG